MSALADRHSLPQSRRRSALERALGPAIDQALSEPDVVEALINADGALWLDRVGLGLVAVGGRLIDRQLEVRPTLRVRPGAPVRVLVTRDIQLRPYRE